MLDYRMFIDGRACGSSDGRTAESVSPRNGAVIGTYPCATKEDVKRALDAAYAAKKSWGGMSFNDRAAILLKAADIFEAHTDEMTRLQATEMGKSITWCRSEYGLVVSLFRSYVSAAMHKYGEVFPNHAASGSLGDVAFTVTEPLGVVCCMAPFNFPVSTLTYKVAPALVMGNTIIIKASSDVALLTLRYVELLLEAGFPENVVQVVSGPGGTITEWILESDKVDGVTFTGSTEVGRILYRESAQHFHRILLELGGNDAMVVCEDADIDEAVSAAMSRIENAGQVCCVSKRFIVHNAIKDRYIEKLKAAVSKVKIGDPLLDDTEMGPCVSERAAKNIEKQIALTVSQGATLVCGGERNGAFLTPAILDNVTKDMDIASDMEVFGPVFPVIGFDTEDEAIEIANNTHYGLNGSVLSGDLARSIRLCSKLHAGTVVANGAGRWRRDIAPFGGVKYSGYGHEGIEDTLDEFSIKKTIVIKGV